MKVTLPKGLSTLFAALETLLGTVENVAYAEGLSPAVAGDPFVVSHSLGIAPEHVSAMPMGDGYCYYTAADKALWSNVSVRLRCSVADTRVAVRVASTLKGG